MTALIDTLIDIVYPKRCGFCGGIKEFGSGSSICSSCNRELADKINIKRSDNGFSVFKYGGDVRKAILGYKYDGRTELGEVFGELMYKVFLRENISFDFDLIIPVPISQKRYEERGYNQTELMAASLSRLSGMPMGEGLIRIKETIPQSRLTIKERYENVEDAFGTDRTFDCKRILLLDDIYTTGSTIKECMKALYSAGAKEVVYCTAAYAELKDNKEE